MQGVVRFYDPQTGEGVVVDERDRADYALSSGALEGSLLPGAMEKLRRSSGDVLQVPSLAP